METEEYFCWNCCTPMEKPIIKPSFCSEKCESVFVEENKKAAEEHEEQIKKDNAVIEEAKKYLTKKQIEIFESSIDDLEYISHCEFVDKPQGRDQSNQYYEEWVDQRSVGDSGDCFTGEVYIKLSNGKFLKYHYDV